MTESEYDATEKVEHTEHGYKLTVTSTRGTGTRDQDKVKAEARTETLAELKNQRSDITALVRGTMEERREHRVE